jgi:uncharacterized protein YukE
VSSVNWHERSLEDLVALAKDTHPAMLGQASTHFQHSATHLSDVQDRFMTHMGHLGDAWQGKAANAAIDNAQSTYESMDNTRSTAAAAGAQTDSYQTSMEHQRTQAMAIPPVDTSWGHAARTGGLAGPIGMVVAQHQAQQKYDDHQTKAAQIVTQMDTAGDQHAQEMKSTPWLPQRSMADQPPASLPPVPGATTSGRSTGSNLPNNGYNGAGSHTSGGGYSSIVGGTTKDPNDNGVLNGPKGPHPTGGSLTTPQSGSSPNPDFPTVPQGGGGLPGNPGGTPDGPVAGGPPTMTAPGGAGAAAAVLGGAGLLGAGAVGGRGLLGGASGRGGLAGEPEGRLGGRGGSGLTEGEGSGLRGGARGGGGLAEGDGAGLRGGSGSGALGDGEGGLRGGPRAAAGVPADEELGAPRNSMLRSASGAGFGGEPVAGEAGRMGGYPMGGSGGRRRNDDEEAPMPDYLVETDDVWGDGASAAPPVIGE